MKQTENPELEELITSLIGNRPIQRDHDFNNLLIYYFLDTTKVDRKDSIRKIMLSKLCFSVLCSEIKPTYQHILTGDLCVVLEDCFDGDTNTGFIMKEINFHNLTGCDEEKLVIANYNAGIEFRNNLIKSLDALLAKVEKEVCIALDRNYHIRDRGNHL